MKRILKEVSQYYSSKEEYSQIISIEETSSVLKWECKIKGPLGSPFSEGIFRLSLEFNSSYPLEAPNVKFITPIFHPNINFKTGEICLNILKDEWSPVWTIGHLLTSISYFLSTPEIDSPLNCDASLILRSGDILAYNTLARMYVIKYAKDSTIKNN
jgi:peroxin-4